MEDDLRSAHRAALQTAAVHVGQPTPEDLRRSTPCAGWSLSDLLGHMIGQHRGFSVAVRTGDAPASAFAPVGLTGPRWNTSVSELLLAFDSAKLEDTAVLVEISPAPRQNAWIVSAQLLDTVVHTWDIAQVLGWSYEPPDDVATVVGRLAAVIPDDERRDNSDSPFAPALPGQGSAWDRALAQLGRNPQPHRQNTREAP